MFDVLREKFLEKMKIMLDKRMSHGYNKHVLFEPPV